METLVSYSDSDSDSEPLHTVSKPKEQSENPPSFGKKDSPSVSSLSSSATSSQQKTSLTINNHSRTASSSNNGQRDFFGLDNDSNSDCESVEETAVGKPRQIEQGAEVPSSKYWEDFSPVVERVAVKPTAVLPQPSPSTGKSVKSVPFVSGGYVNQDDSVKSSRRKVYFVHHLISQYLSRDSHSRPRNEDVTVAAHTGVVNRVRWCRRRDYSHLAASCSSDTTVKLWNLFSDHDHFIGCVYRHEKAVSSISWSSNGRNLLSGSYDRSAVISDVEKSQVISKFEHSNHVTKVEYHSDDHRIFMCIAQDRIYSWDLRTTSKPVRILRHPRKEVTKFFDMAYINEGRELVVSTDSCEHNLCVFDIKTGALVSLEREIFPERYTCPRLVTSRYHRCFLAQTQGNYVCEFGTTRPYKLNKYKRFQGHCVEGYPIGFDVTCDSNTVVCGSSDSGLYLYDWFSGKNFGKISTSLGVCVDVGCHPVMGNVVLAASWDGQIALIK